MTKKTHREVKNPEITIRYLADYMAASGQGRRTILRKCKYQPRAALIQHTDAKSNISNHLRTRKGDQDDLNGKIDRLSRKICDTPFEEGQLKHNVDYVKRFAQVADEIDFPNADILKARQIGSIDLNGTKLKFTPDLLMTRTTKTNAIKIGAVAFRYLKAKPLDEEVAAYQSAAIFGFLDRAPFDEEADPERQLC